MSQHNNQSENTARRNIYFLSDAHLGSLAIPHPRMQERRLVNFLDSIKHKAEAVYLMGDIFDFWYEYKNVVPKGYTRLLGKSASLPIWASKYTTLLVITIFGNTIILKKSVA